MIITCEQCEASFNLDEGLLKPTGSRVRCSKCKHVFRAYPPAPDQTCVEAVTVLAPPGPAEELFESDIPVEAERPREEESPAGFSLDSEDMGSAAVEATEEEIDFSTLDKGPDLEPGGVAGERVPEATGEVELLLDLNLDSDQEERAAVDIAEEKLDLSNLEEELSIVSERKEPALSESGEEDLQLDLSLDKGEETLAAAETGEEEIDLSDLEKELSAASEVSEPTPSESGEEDLHLDLGLDEDEETPATAETDQEGIDLSDLEKELSLAEEVEETALDETGEKDLEFDLGLDDSEKKPSVLETAEEELYLSSLEEELSLAEDSPENLSLEMESDVNELTQAEPGSEEVDLSDIEGLLEEEPVEKPEKKGADDLTDLDLESEEIDVTELEKMLDEEKESAPVAASEEPEDLDLDLDIDIEPAPETASESTASAAGKMDSAGLEMKSGPDKTLAASLYATTEDLELEFITEEPAEEELRMEEKPDIKFSDETVSDVAVAVDNGSVYDTDAEVPEIEIEEEAVEETDRKTRTKTPPVLGAKKRTGKLSIILLIVVLLIGSVVILPTLGIQIPFVGGYLKEFQIVDSIGKIPFGDYLRKIPYVGDLLGAKVDEQGNLKMASFDINSKFIENTKSGTLFVVSGKIRNDYDRPRAFVKVSGRLYSTGRKLSKTLTVFCGNSLSESELSTLDIAAIRKRLLERAGEKNANALIPPGRDVPFMLVFSDLPPDLEEFDIQVEESMPAS